MPVESFAYAAFAPNSLKPSLWSSAIRRICERLVLSYINS